MSKWKQITTNLARTSAILGIATILNACVVASTPHGHYVDPYASSAYIHWYYYPDYQVYYHSTEHYYYYYDGGTWIRATRLPSGWVLRDQRRVKIRINGIPYVKHSNHLRRYPPRRANHRRPDLGGRPGSDNSHRHRQDMGKEDRNMFIPHTKENRTGDKGKYPRKFKKSGNGKLDRDEKRGLSKNIKSNRSEDSSGSVRSSKPDKYKQKSKSGEKYKKEKRTVKQKAREYEYEDDEGEDYRRREKSRESIRNWRK